MCTAVLALVNFADLLYKVALKSDFAAWHTVEGAVLNWLD